MDDGYCFSVKVPALPLCGNANLPKKQVGAALLFRAPFVRHKVGRSAIRSRSQAPYL